MQYEKSATHTSMECDANPIETPPILNCNVVLSGNAKESSEGSTLLGPFKFHFNASASQAHAIDALLVAIRR